MNTRKKEIRSVETSDWCQESYPCQHDVTITYKDGTEKQTHASGDDIANKYFDYLNQIQKGHFVEYLDKAGIFGNQSSSTKEPKPDNNQDNTQNARYTWRMK